MDIRGCKAYNEFVSWTINLIARESQPTSVLEIIPDLIVQNDGERGKERVQTIRDVIEQMTVDGILKYFNKGVGTIIVNPDAILEEWFTSKYDKYWIHDFRSKKRFFGTAKERFTELNEYLVMRKGERKSLSGPVPQNKALQLRRENGIGLKSPGSERRSTLTGLRSSLKRPMSFSSPGISSSNQEGIIYHQRSHQGQGTVEMTSSEYPLASKKARVDNSSNTSPRSKTNHYGIAQEDAFAGGKHPQTAGNLPASSRKKNDQSIQGEGLFIAVTSDQKNSQHAVHSSVSHSSPKSFGVETLSKPPFAGSGEEVSTLHYTSTPDSQILIQMKELMDWFSAPLHQLREWYPLAKIRWVVEHEKLFIRCDDCPRLLEVDRKYENLSNVQMHLDGQRHGVNLALNRMKEIDTLSKEVANLRQELHDSKAQTRTQNEGLERKITEHVTTIFKSEREFNQHQGSISFEEFQVNLEQSLSTRIDPFVRLITALQEEFHAEKNATNEYRAEIADQMKSMIQTQKRDNKARSWSVSVLGSNIRKDLQDREVRYMGRFDGFQHRLDSITTTTKIPPSEVEQEISSEGASFESNLKM